MENTRSLDQMKGGEGGRISHLALEQNPDLYRLLSMGVVPGSAIEVIQRFPTFVVQINQSQLAFDEQIAKSIFVSTP